MSVDLKRVRDAHEDGTGNLSPASKKRLLGHSPSGSGFAGGQSPMSSAGDADDSGIEDWMRVVETRRKEAIYRQMLEYKRASRDAANKAHQYEAQVKRIQASEYAMAACWEQVVSVISDLAGQPSTSPQAFIEPVLDPEESHPALQEQLAKRSATTQSLVMRFIDLCKQGNPASTGELEKRCAKLHSETTSLRAVNKTLKSEIATLKGARDQAQSSLNRSQKALDRQRMDHDKERSAWGSGNAVASSSAPGQGQGNGGALTPGGAGAAASASGSRANGPTPGHATPNGIAGAQRNGVGSDSSTDVKPVLNDASEVLAESTSLERLAETRLRELQKVSEENTALNRELDRLRQMALNPSEEALRSAPFFQIYLRQLACQASELTSTRSRLLTSEGKLDELRNQNLAFRDAVVADGRAEAEALRAQVGKQNSDLARLRGQRDDMQAELQERRLREEHAVGSGAELEVLAKAQGERIGTLLSEVRRLKGALGADRGKGERGYLDWLVAEGVEGDYVQSLEAKVRDLEVQLRASTLPADASIHVELENAKRDLERYQRILGPNAEAGDLSAMAAKLEQADEAKRVLELKLEESNVATNSLYSEVESLAKLSDTLQTQLSSKAFEMRDADGKMARLATEKAKADNKYFQAMRSKEAIEAECRTAQRSVDKQARLLEKALEVEKTLQAQVALQEKMLTGLKNDLLDLQGRFNKESESRREGEIRLGQAQTSLAEANSIMQQRVADAAAEREQRIRHQEDAEKAVAQVERLKEKQKNLVAASAGQNISASEAQAITERDKALRLLRCGTCDQNFKERSITRCGHMFCAPCIDSRVSTRQRKCPACGVAFSKEEVQTLYW